jgi:hypothetical protein
MFKAVFTAVFAAFVLFHSQASAFDQPVAAGATVRIIESSYMPDGVFFQISTPVANCPALSWLAWEGGLSFPRGSDEAKRQASIKAVSATLLTAFAAGKKVNIYARNSSGSGTACVVEFIHVVD